MINTYNESDLHKSLKEMYCPKNGEMEYPLLGSVCDIFYAKNKIIEIQTSNISALRVKLEKFLPNYKVKIIYPIIINSYNIVLDESGNKLHRRKSPKHGVLFQIFRELSGLYHLINNNNISFDILYIDCETIKQHGINIHKRKRHKNRPSVINRKLLNILEVYHFENMKDVCFYVLDLLPKEFTNKHLKDLNAGKYSSYTTWFLKKVGLIFPDGKKGNFILYKKSI